MRVIAADIGGTKSWLLLAEISSTGTHKVLHEARYGSADFTDFEELLTHYLDECGQQAGSVSQLCLAFPGPVKGDQVSLTNLDWTISASLLKNRFTIDKVFFINDFEAAAMGTVDLPEQDYLVLNPGAPRPGARRAVIGAGTGLGTAYMHFQDNQYQAFSTEGGHISFAPQDEQQTRLMNFLSKRYGHVSFERILSGQGLVDLYHFVANKTSVDNMITAGWVNRAASSGDNAAARETLSLFVRIYGAYAGNIAMIFKPEGGLYLVGGVTAKISHWMESGEFMKAYRSKGRMEMLVAEIPVLLVSNERIGLQGAIRYAEHKMGKVT